VTRDGGVAVGLAGWSGHCTVAAAGVPETAVRGKTRKSPRHDLKSPFSRRSEVHGACVRLLAGCRARHVLPTAGEVQRLEERRGSVIRRGYRYPGFGRGTGLARKRSVVEHSLALRRG
jgi:hypothetical protein